MERNLVDSKDVAVAEDVVEDVVEGVVETAVVHSNSKVVEKAVVHSYSNWILEQSDVQT